MIFSVYKLVERIRITALSCRLIVETRIICAHVVDAWRDYTQTSHSYFVGLSSSIKRPFITVVNELCPVSTQPIKTIYLINNRENI